jgi:thiol-disulfide isomerase/thioredoxin
MKKFFQILGIIFGIAVVGIGALLIKGPADPIILTPEEEAQEQEQEIKQYANVDLIGFNAKTITGESVTSDYFKDYDVTMINIWNTGCGPCIDEMPDIAELYKTKPENTNIISICVDLVDNKKEIKFANKVMEDAKAEFITLIPDAVLREKLTDDVQIFPTTIFVDSNGKTVGTPHFGGRLAEDYRQAILDRVKLVNEMK